MIINCILIIMPISIIVIAIKSYKPFLEACKGDKEARLKTKTILILLEFTGIMMLIGLLLSVLTSKVLNQGLNIIAHLEIEAYIAVYITALMYYLIIKEYTKRVNIRLNKENPHNGNNE